MEDFKLIDIIYTEFHMFALMYLEIAIYTCRRTTHNQLQVGQVTRHVQVIVHIRHAVSGSIMTICIFKQYHLVVLTSMLK